MENRPFGATRKVVPGQRRSSGSNQKNGNFFNNDRNRQGNTNSKAERYVLEEKPMENGELVEGSNRVQLIGYIGYQQLADTPQGHVKLTALFFIPFTDKNGDRKRIGYKITAWDDTAEQLNDIEAGTPLQIHGSLNKYTPKDAPERYDVKVEEFWIL